MADPEARRRALQKDIEWYRQQIASLERDRRRVPWILALLVAVVPAGYRLGLVGVALTIAAVIGTMMVALYLIAGHRDEYLDKIRHREEEIRSLGPE